MDGPDLRRQLVLGLRTRLLGALGGEPLVVALPTLYHQDAAQPRDTVPGVMFRDEPVAADHRPISFAKYGAALRRISFSNSSSATLFRSRRSSSRSPKVCDRQGARPPRIYVDREPSIGSAFTDRGVAGESAGLDATDDLTGHVEADLEACLREVRVVGVSGL
jgi:hypothetical protein